MDLKYNRWTLQVMSNKTTTLPSVALEVVKCQAVLFVTVTKRNRSIRVAKVIRLLQSMFITTRELKTGFKM
jgi:hypothetical protein